MVPDRLRVVGTAPRGICAVDSDGNVRLFVAHGRMPRLSPDRRRVAFAVEWHADPTLHELDAATNACRRIEDTVRSLRHMLSPPAEPVLRPHALIWEPAADKIVIWGSYMQLGGGDQSFQGPFAIPAHEEPPGEETFFMGRALISSKVLDPHRGAIGRISFGPEARAACEWSGERLWCGNRVAQVSQYDRRRERIEQVDVAIPGCVGAMNPCGLRIESGWRWMPCSMAGGRASAWFCLLIRGWLAGCRAPQGRMSPGARTARDFCWPAPLQGQVCPAVVSLAGTGEFRMIIRTYPVVQARWSPTGRRIAWVTGASCGAALGATGMRWTGVGVRVIVSKRLVERCPSFPKGLVPVSVES